MDRWLAKHYPQINLIVGGHSHDLIEHGEKVGHTWITQTGKWGNYVGDIHLELEDHHVIKVVLALFLLLRCQKNRKIRQ